MASTLSLVELVWSMAKLGKRHLATVLIGAGMGNLDHDVAVACWLRGIAAALDPRSAEIFLYDQVQPGARTEASPSMVVADVQRITFVQLNPENALHMLKAFE